MDHLEDLSVDVRIILWETVKQKRGRMWRGFIWLRIKMSGFFEHGYIKQGGEVFLPA
jgi:hypothetical protein